MTKSYDDRSAELFRDMYLIRRFEENLLSLFEQGEVSGTTHCYIGQEANAVGVVSHLHDDDVIVSNHRCHGHYLSRTKNTAGLLAEIMGKEGGIVSGRGGSQHICDDDVYTNGILGGTAPMAAGMAMAEDFKESGSIVTVFLGDGALGEGDVYETLNMASLWDVPLLFVVENNSYSQSTSIEDNMSGEIVDRFDAFDIPAEEMESFDVEEIFDTAGPIVDRVREGDHPQALVLHTYRFCSHSKSPDGRDQEEVDQWREEHDPLDIQRERVSADDLERVRDEVERSLEEAVEYARESPWPELKTSS